MYIPAITKKNAKLASFSFPQPLPFLNLPQRLPTECTRYLDLMQYFCSSNKIFITFLQVLNKKRYNWPAMSFSLSSLATLDSVFLLPIGQQGRWIQRHFTFTFGNQYIGFFKGDSRFITAVVMGEVPTDPLSSSTLLEKMPMLKSLQ